MRRFAILAAALLALSAFADAARLKVAVPVMPTYVTKAEEGNGGAIIEWAVRVSAELKTDFDLVRCLNYGELVEKLQRGDVDIAFGLPLNSVDGVDFGHIFLGRLRTYLKVRKGSRFRLNDPPSWSRAKIGCLRGSPVNRDLVVSLAECKTDAEMREFDSVEAASKAFAAGEVDMLLTCDPLCDDGEEIVYAVHALPYYIAVASGRGDLAARCDQAVRAIFQTETHIANRIDAKYHRVPRGLSSTFTMREKQLIAKYNQEKTLPRLKLEGIATLPAGVTGRDRINRILAESVRQLIFERSGLDLQVYPSIIFDREAILYSWKLGQIWDNATGAADEDVELAPVGKLPREVEAIIWKTLADVTQAEMLRLVYHAVTEGQDRAFLTPRQQGAIIGIVVALAFLAVALRMFYTNRRIRIALEQARHAESVKARFIATVSHEIRTPLNAIVGFSEHLQNCSEKEAELYTGGIRKSSEVLLSLINDVLDLSKLEAGKMDVWGGRCDFMRTASTVHTVFSEQARMKGLKYEAEFPEACPDLAISETCLRLVAVNLIGNALKYTRKGKVRVVAKVEPTNEPGYRSIYFEVSDTGCGIAPEAIGTIFDPFTRDLKGQGGQVYEGTGLGLPIVKKILDQLGATIEVKSEVGKGSTFIARLPRVEALGEAHGVRTIAAAKETGVRGDLKVAVVDDVEMNLKIMKIHLEKAGCANIQVFRNANRAIEGLRRFPADIIFTDMWMPEMNGDEFARHCRGDAALRRKKIVLVTADASEGSLENSPFDDILLKPVTFDKVREVVKRFGC